MAITPTSCENDCPAVQNTVSIPVMCSDVVVYPYQIYQARLAGADALKLIAPALPPKVGLVMHATVQRQFVPPFELRGQCVLWPRWASMWWDDAGMWRLQL